MKITKIIGIAVSIIFLSYAGANAQVNPNKVRPDTMTHKFPGKARTDTSVHKYNPSAPKKMQPDTSRRNKPPYNKPRVTPDTSGRKPK